jgi:hypothetical protein
MMDEFSGIDAFSEMDSSVDGSAKSGAVGSSATVSASELVASWASEGQAAQMRNIIRGRICHPLIKQFTFIQNHHILPEILSYSYFTINILGFLILSLADRIIT